MKQVSKVLAYIGGIGSAVLALLVLLVVWLRRVFGRVRGERAAVGVSAWSFFVLIFAIVGIIGAALVESRPKAGGVLSLTGGAGIVLAVIVSAAARGYLGVVDLVEALFALLLLAAGVLGLISSGPRKANSSTGSAAS